MILALALFATDAVAQGVQTGTLRGLVTDQQDLAVPGVTVTVRSNALQGTRSATTETDGTYLFVTLPPGAYTVNFEIAGFTSVERTAQVPLGASIDLNVTLRPSGVAEEVQVVGTAPQVETASVGLNILQDEVESLATSRTLFGIATLSPGLNENTPNTSQISINGAFAFDNLFMLNGVDINDNLFGSPQDLFIEEAIAETQVITSGLSAEYGRFTGGVVNAITKSGGNEFEGSYRLNLTNPAWTDETPFDEDNDVEFESDVNLTNEMTFGGPLLRDRLWFFAAARLANVSESGAAPVTGIPFSSEDKNRRGEIKLTGTVAPNQTFQFGYLNNSTESVNVPSLNSAVEIDPNHTYITEKAPNWYTFMNYRGVIGGDWLAEAQFSERRFRFENQGGTSLDIRDSPMWTADFLYQYNAPYFDGNDPEERNNRQLTANITRFFEGAGRHEFKGGYEFFRSQVTGGGGQSSTDYIFYAHYLKNPDGSPMLDEDGYFIPEFVPITAGEDSWSEYDNWRPQRGARLDIDTQSFFVQDRWTIDRNLTANLGVRYERVQSDASGLAGVDTNTVVPRLGLAYDVGGNGRTILNATYGHYAGRYNEATFSSNSNVSNPDVLFAFYVGPQGAGRDFAPGFDPDNYVVYFGRFPRANVTFAEGLSSPIVKEFSLSATRQLNERATAEVTYVWRDTTNIIEDFTDIANGFTEVLEDGEIFGPFTNTVYDNTDLAGRSYQGLVFQGNYRIQPNWSLTGHWTIQLKNDGNYEGEGQNQPGLVSVIGDFPEIVSESRHFPTGRNSNFQRHRVRLWSIYNHNMGRHGDLSFSGLLRVESAQAYSLSAAVQGLSDIQEELATEAGYPDRPTTLTVFFDERGSELFKGYGALDLSVNYNIPIWRSLSPWIKFDIFNALNNRKMIAWDNTIFPDFEGPVDALGIPTDYVEDAAFGQATTAAHYVVPRRFRIAMGFRF